LTFYRIGVCGFLVLQNHGFTILLFCQIWGLLLLGFIKLAFGFDGFIESGFCGFLVFPNRGFTILLNQGFLVSLFWGSRVSPNPVF